MYHKFSVVRAWTNQALARFLLTNPWQTKCVPESCVVAKCIHISN